jgi:VanZ family protein
MHSRALPVFLPKVGVPGLWLTFAAWVAVLIYASTRPGSEVFALPILYFDKLEHVAFFFAGAISLGAAMRATFPIRWATLFLIAVVALCGLGLADEINQLFVTGRSGGDPFDWLADLTGSACGLAVLRSFYAKRPRENPAPPTGDRAA